MISLMEILKILNRRTAAGKVLRDKAFNIAKDPKYDLYQCGLASVVYKSLDIETYGSGIKNGNISNKELAEELHNQLLEKLIKEKYIHLLLTIFGWRCVDK